MFITILLTILYILTAVLVFYMARNFKKALEIANAFTPDTAVPLQQNEIIAVYFASFGWSAFKMTEDGRFWFAQNAWKPMLTLAIIIFVVSLITLLFLITSYF